MGIGVRRGRGTSGLGTLTRLPSDYTTSTAYLRRRHRVFRGRGIFDPAVVSKVVDGLADCGSLALHGSLGSGPRKVLTLIGGCFRYKWFSWGDKEEMCRCFSLAFFHFLAFAP